MSTVYINHMLLIFTARLAVWQEAVIHWLEVTSDWHIHVCADWVKARHGLIQDGTDVKHTTTMQVVVMMVVVVVATILVHTKTTTNAMVPTFLGAIT